MSALAQRLHRLALTSNVTAWRARLLLCAKADYASRSGFSGDAGLPGFGGELVDIVGTLEDWRIGPGEQGDTRTGRWNPARHDGEDVTDPNA
jgi:hypothetical protein